MWALDEEDSPALLGVRPAQSTVPQAGRGCGPQIHPAHRAYTMAAASLSGGSCLEVKQCDWQSQAPLPQRHGGNHRPYIISRLFQAPPCVCFQPEGQGPSLLEHPGATHLTSSSPPHVSSASCRGSRQHACRGPESTCSGGKASAGPLPPGPPQPSRSDITALSDSRRAPLWVAEAGGSMQEASAQETVFSS